jgi:glutaredoxin 3
MKKITVYSAGYCPYCTQAKRLLTELKLTFEDISLDGNDELREKLSAENGGYRTVPMIFIGDEFIGGFSDLAALHRQGLLTSKVQDA